MSAQRILFSQLPVILVILSCLSVRCCLMNETKDSILDAVDVVRRDGWRIDCARAPCRRALTSLDNVGQNTCQYNASESLKSKMKSNL